MSLHWIVQYLLELIFKGKLTIYGLNGQLMVSNSGHFMLSCTLLCFRSPNLVKLVFFVY